MSIRIVLADDQLVLRQGLRALFEAERELEIVGEADNGRVAIDLVRQLQPDLVLMELAMPELDGIAATEIINQEFPEVRVLILSGLDEDTAVVSAVRAGAIGFVSKTTSFEALVKAIRAAALGQVQLSPAAAARLVQEVHSPMDQPERLTGRELEVLDCVVQGFANKEIAWKLRISEKTVKSHVSTILGKFGLESRTQAAMHATRMGLVSPRPAVVGEPVHFPQRGVVSINRSWQTTHGSRRPHHAATA
jgi:two-component system, NarL family, response regulator LiaR